MSEFNVLQRFRSTKSLDGAPKRTMVLAQGDVVGTYVPVTPDPMVPRGFSGETVGNVPDVQVQTVYTREQIQILNESGIDVVIARVDNRRAEADRRKVENSSSNPAVRPEVRQLITAAYESAKAARRR